MASPNWSVVRGFGLEQGFYGKYFFKHGSASEQQVADYIVRWWNKQPAPHLSGWIERSCL